ncbi:neprilysin-4-like isoform X3 [Danaus plexippus]|uniref:neprilysin-4-like isoform X3 n=1 Tax=Danaus plexippus TaxID=13037 RepID=UPI002AB16571|nr:neprilysin-4-like isoform X3 [Danaus plexippus]
MARVDSTPQTVSIKPKSANFCRFIIIIVLTLFCAVAYFISRRPLDTLGDPSDQFTVKNIPNIYTRLESVDPEEREVFQGFQTSFLPPEEVVLSRKGFEDSDEVLDSNVTSDIFKWEEKRRENPTRVKRGSHSTFSTQDYDRETPTQNQQNVEDIQEDDDDGNEKEMVYGSDSDQHDEERNMQSVVHPEIYVDRGPLDDVEQVRRQPELEEGEMGSAAHLYKPVRSYTGVHAFWKGQGDKETIRHTQSKIMRQYMDAEADPCHDFYQYACGNWPTLNPIPADKAGLAKITSAPEDRRNVSELYRRMTLAKLEGLVPEIKWRKYLCIVMNRTIDSSETVVLFALSYVRHLVQLIKKTDPNTLSNYLLWRFVRHRVNNLDDRFQSAKQQFYYILFGREQAPPRWKNCISQVNSNMGMALGSMFVRKYFDEMSKNDTMTMTREIQQAFRELLHMTDWIDEETKKLAAHKVDSMMLRIGYPDFILNKKELDDRYKEVQIHPDKYFENILNILQHLTKMEQSRIGQPVNKTLWNTAPAVVNAYYSRNKNQIMFPAGILQPPFYHRHFPRSLNFGGIGVVIGHEITHGFDDKGRLFDCEGNLHRWWSDSAIEAFHRRAQCLIDQYGRYVVPEVNMKLDGVNTQGENIADNGGVKQAFHAYQRWLLQHGAVDETLPELNHTSTQLFFLNFAQVWCGAMRPEAMRNKLKTAVHSPGRFRVIGTLSNSLDFAREFQCPPGSPMNPIHKCSVW